MENLGKLEKISPETSTVKLTQLPCKGRNYQNFLQTKNSIVKQNKVTFFSSSLILVLQTGADIEPYLPTLMETMLSALNNTDNLKIKELAVSAIGAIGNRLSGFYTLTSKKKKKRVVVFWLTV